MSNHVKVKNSILDITLQLVQLDLLQISVLLPVMFLNMDEVELCCVERLSHRQTEVWSDSKGKIRLDLMLPVCSKSRQKLYKRLTAVLAKV